MGCRMAYPKGCLKECRMERPKEIRSAKDLETRRSKATALAKDLRPATIPSPCTAAANRTREYACD